MALYDYNPLMSSPSDNPEFELTLREGNLIKVFGQELAEGYLVGEVCVWRGGREGGLVMIFMLCPSRFPAGWPERSGACLVCHRG